jgi:predicted MPP superfamily phosphohydrolase
MFAEYNHDHYPIVFVNFSEAIESEDEFDQFLNEWLLLYHSQRDFSFIFDTRNMKNISLKYAIKMTLFIKELRKEKYHYLQKSLILVNNKSIKRLLDFVFTLQSPVAPVYIWLNDDDISDYSLIETLNTINRLDLRDDMIYIKPNNSFIPFL